MFKDYKKIFKNNNELLNKSEVQELIEYVSELEGLIMDNNISKTYSKEKILFNILMDIYESC